MIGEDYSLKLVKKNLYPGIKSPTETFLSKSFHSVTVTGRFKGMFSSKETVVLYGWEYYKITWFYLLG